MTKEDWAMDGIGNFLTALRNAVGAKLSCCETSSSRTRLDIAKILKSTGYLDGVEKFTDPKGHPRLRMVLRYVDGISPIVSIERCSKPGRRIYAASKSIPRVLNGMGIVILSTSRGLMKDAEARRQNIGGELLCKVW
jgi:small subunit ribosomal protein S8